MLLKYFNLETNLIKPLILSLCLIFASVNIAHSFELQENEQEYTEYSGIIIDAQSNKPLVFASIGIENTNISTVTNNEGEFLLKVPDNINNASVVISFLGYSQKTIPLSDLKKRNNRISLEASTIELSEINVTLPKDAKELVRKTLKNKGINNLNQETLMTAFYRETIKKRRKNVSLAEAIVTLYKEPYNSVKRDKIKLYKARKNTDYTRLDTLALKLQGGPFNALYIDLMKYPQFIFSDDTIDLYSFSFGPSTTINDQPVYVVNFKQRDEIGEPLYYGKLFIDSKSLALTSALYDLNVENKTLASALFVKRKPRDVKVYPTKAAYRVDYRQKNGKWYYGYSNVQLTFKVIKKGKLFNSIYSLSSEMAVTDWKLNIDQDLKNKERLKPSIIIADEASGFSDPEFWGAYNVIEPEKSIESAIKKIQRQLKRIENSQGQ
ncbi:MAG: carboxypeptidase-like regulatory domain-containing protein [Flavobacteriaceae bacterium]|nr:carboxypeptidase-like regulatory domain-containing protein [Flavobacteriaceae bacterium]